LLGDAESVADLFPAVAGPAGSLDGFASELVKRGGYAAGLAKSVEGLAFPIARGTNTDVLSMTNDPNTSSGPHHVTLLRQGFLTDRITLATALGCAE
jgi:hypothetical protein